MRGRIAIAAFVFALVGAACSTTTATKTEGGSAESDNAKTVTTEKDEDVVDGTCGEFVDPATTESSGKSEPIDILPPDFEHQHGEEGYVEPEPVELSPEDQESFDQQMADAVEIIETFPTVADAEAAGYVRAGVYYPLIGAHYVNQPLAMVPFTVKLPALLLAEGNAPDCKIIGLSYLAMGETPPEGFVGPNDFWHSHSGVCFDTGNDSVEVLSFGGMPQEECESLDAQFLDLKFNMNHVWNVPGFESPDGLFSAENRNLKCPDGSVDYDVKGCLSDPTRTDL